MANSRKSSHIAPSAPPEVGPDFYEWVKRQVDEAPPLTDDQFQRIRHAMFGSNKVSVRSTAAAPAKAA